jgi:hypothetical protein
MPTGSNSTTPQRREDRNTQRPPHRPDPILPCRQIRPKLGIGDRWERGARICPCPGRKHRPHSRASRRQPRRPPFLHQPCPRVAVVWRPWRHPNGVRGIARRSDRRLRARVRLLPAHRSCDPSQRSSLTQPSLFRQTHPPPYTNLANATVALPPNASAVKCTPAKCKPSNISPEVCPAHDPIRPQTAFITVFTASSRPNHFCRRRPPGAVHMAIGETCTPWACTGGHVNCVCCCDDPRVADAQLTGHATGVLLFTAVISRYAHQRVRMHIVTICRAESFHY